MIARNTDVPNFETDSIDAVVTAALAAGMARSLPLTSWDSFPPASFGGWQAFWRGLFEQVAKETAQPLSDYGRTLKIHLNALVALCVLCAYDPMEIWLDITQQKQQQLHNRLLMNYFIGLTCAAVRLTKSHFNSIKVHASDLLDSASGRARSGSGGVHRAVAAFVALDSKCVCLQWSDDSSDGECSAFSNTNLTSSIGDIIAFDAVMEARSSALVRSWWDAIISAYGPTPLIASHLTRYMMRCCSTAGLCFAVQCTHRCLPTVALVACMYNLFCRQCAPFGELKYHVNRAAHAWDRASKISESYSSRDTAVREKYSAPSVSDTGRDNASLSSSTAASLAVQLAWLPSLDRECVNSCIASACSWLMNPPCSVADDICADSCPPLREITLAVSSQSVRRQWPATALRALLAAAMSPRASFTNFFRCCYGPRSIAKIAREMRPIDFAAYLAALPHDQQMTLVAGIIGSACESVLPGLEMNGNIAAIPVHLHYTLLNAGVGDVWISGFVACIKPWIESYASSGTSSEYSSTTPSSSCGNGNNQAIDPDDAAACVERMSPHVLLQVVKLMMFMSSTGNRGLTAVVGGVSVVLTPFFLSSLVCARFLKKFLRWANSDCSRVNRSVHADIDIILWLLLQRDDLARASLPSPTSAASSTEGGNSSHVSDVFKALAPHHSITVLRSIYYTFACDTFTLDDAHEVSVRPSVLTALRRGCHDHVSSGFARGYLRVCVGRMLEALMAWHSATSVQVDVNDGVDGHDRSAAVAVDASSASWQPAPIFPFAACHHPSSSLDLLRHLLTRIDMNTMAAGGLQDYPRPPAPNGGWMPEALVGSKTVGASVDEHWLNEQLELLAQVVECVAAAALRFAPFSGSQQWQNSFGTAASSSAAASCVSYLSSLTCGHVRLDCTAPCSLDACDVKSRVLFSMKQPKQASDMESITAHALLPLYYALLYQGPMALALRSAAAMQLLRLSQHIRIVSYFHWLKDFSSKHVEHCCSRDDLCCAAPLLSCACVAVAVIQECQKTQIPPSVLHALTKMADSSTISHRLNAIACTAALVDAGFVAALASSSPLSPVSSSSSILESALIAPWDATTHVFADAPGLQRPLSDPSHHALIAVAKLYKAVFACKKHLKASPRMQASLTRSFHEFFKVHVLRPSVPLQLLSFVVTCVYPEGGERVRCMLEGQCDIVAGCGMRRLLLLCDGAFCRWPVLCGADGGTKEMLPDECAHLLAKLRSASHLEAVGITIVCRPLLQQIDVEQRAMLMLSEALNDGLSSSFEAISLLLRRFVDDGDAEFRGMALRMCVNVLIVERDVVHRRSAAGSSSTAVPRLQLVATILALCASASVRGTLERCATAAVM